MNTQTPWNIDREIPELRKEYFEKEFHDFDLESGYDDRTVEWFKAHILTDALSFFSSKENLLDVGCASGYFSRILKESFTKVQGIDFCEVRINHAQQYESEDLKFQLGDLTKIEHLEALNKTFDNFYSSAVIPHINLADKARVFDNLAAIAKPGATFVLYDGYSDKAANIHDEFVGVFNEKWLSENISTWRVVNCGHLVRDVFRYVLKKTDEAPR
jgi:2-polyprenyl-3-methyl-5-hydroxy-6-metoxy-1,4-benzoquinol methylase